MEMCNTGVESSRIIVTIDSMLLTLTHHLHWPVWNFWKSVGLFGVVLFASRWIVQVFASHRAGRPVMTPLFWWLSLLGSLFCLSYFIFGKNDSVGIISYLFPAFISLYNLLIDRRRRRSSR